VRVIQSPEIRKKPWGGEFWSDGGYIGTVKDGVNSEIIKRYIQEQGSKEEKAGAQLIQLFPL
jgi:putative transposase